MTVSVSVGVVVRRKVNVPLGLALDVVVLNAMVKVCVSVCVVTAVVVSDVVLVWDIVVV